MPVPSCDDAPSAEEPLMRPLPWLSLSSPLRSLAPLMLLSLVFALPGAVPQPQDPRPEALRVEVVTPDGVPQPGALVGVLPIVAGAGDGLRNGWLRAHDPRLAQLAAANHWRTGADGIAEVAWPGDPRGRYELSVAPPYRLLSTLRVANGVQRLTVRRLEPFVVRVVDTAGQPLPRFPLGLHSNGQLESVARSDAAGLVTFGIEPSHRAGLVVVPFGWVGPHDGFPTIALQSRDRVATLTVPPHGFVRVRALVHGEPRAAAVRGVAMHAPSRHELGRPRDVEAEDCQGVLLGPVPLGEPLRGELRVRRAVLPFSAPALRTAGEERIVDVETEPARPQFVARLSGAPPSLSLARFVVHTDRGTFLDMPVITADGRVTARFDRTEWNGTRVRRVELVGAELGGGEPRMWSGSVVLDLALLPTTLDVGTLALQSSAPALRGRVVDPQGRPVAGARVEVESAPGSAAVLRCSVTCDPHGGFVVLQPAATEPDGRPASLVATAVSAFGREVATGAPSAPQPVGSEVTLVLGVAERGFLHVVVDEPRTVPPAALRFQFVNGDGRTFDVPPAHVRPAPGPDGHLRLGPLPLGSGELRVRLRSGAEIARIASVEVQAPAAADPEPDESLVRVDAAAHVRSCRLRVVDGNGVPIRGATLSVRDGSALIAIATSDEGGCAEFVLGRTQRLRLEVDAPGCQPLVVEDPDDGGQVQLQPRRSLCVAVTGLPADVDRERIEVMFHPVERGNLGDATQARLGGSDQAAVPLPRAGGYRVLLVVRQRGRADRDGGSGSWGVVGERAEPVVVAADAEPSAFEFAVDAAMLARLRAALAQPAK